MDVELNQESRGPAQGAEALAKAESWLSRIADKVEKIEDQEALVYLRSRGRDCHEQIAKLIELWKEAEQDRLDDYKSRVTHAQDVSDIVGVSPMHLRDFWGAAPLGDHTSEATMLRTVEWCEIPGFDRWWQRLARIHQDFLLRGGFENPVPASYWLFSMLRCDYAIRLMRGTLDRCLEAISLPDPGNPWPWRFVDEKSAGFEEHLPYASAIVFAGHRLTPSNAKLMREAVERICRHQDKTGGWRTWTDAADASVETTAMALHALALEQPPGWRRMAAHARNWLLSVQKGEGYWTESGAPGAVHLTVLVLDAIALADGAPGSTFRWAPGSKKASPESEEARPSIAGIEQCAEPVSGTTSAGLPAPEPNLDTSEGRKAAVKAYIQEVFDRTGKRITKTDIWKEARYKRRSDFERWQRCDVRATQAAHQRFARILREKPHLK